VPTRQYTGLLPQPGPSSFPSWAAESHGAKLTPRLGAPLAIWPLAGNATAVIAFNFACGLGVLLITLLGVHRATGDRTAATWAGVLVALSPVAAFTMGRQEYLFDPLALVFTGLAWLWRRNSFVCGLCLFLGLWCDERVLLAGMLVPFSLLLEGDTVRGAILRGLLLVPFVLLYLGGRWWLAGLLEWNLQYNGTGGEVLWRNWSFAPLMGVVTLEGAAVLALLAGAWLWREGRHLAALALLAAVLLTGLACCTVLDMSRTATFAWPLLPALCVFTATRLRPANARLAAGLALGAALFVPTYNLVWQPQYFLHTYPPTPVSFVLWLVNG